LSYAGIAQDEGKITNAQAEFKYNRRMSLHLLHVDMDAFFAAIEQRDNPALRGRPVIVGAPPDRRGVVATCSYEARVFACIPPCRRARLLNFARKGSFCRDAMRTIRTFRGR